MNRYRVSCIMRKDSDWTKTFHASAEANHPDIAKQKILAKHPKHTMLDIEILDMTPMPSAWDKQIKRPPVKSMIFNGKQKVDLDRTWRKELAR